MRKILVILGVLLMTSGMGQAFTCDDFRCPANPYDGSFSFSNLTGVNFLAERIGNTLIKKAILKDSKGKYKDNKLVAGFCTYALSAIWHGFYPSYYVSFLIVYLFEQDGLFLKDIGFYDFIQRNKIMISKR